MRPWQEVFLPRLRMGCTLPTHIFLYIAKSFPPQCTCQVILNVDYILLYCVWYREALRSFAAYCRSRLLPLTQATLSYDKHPVIIDKVMTFLTETNLISEMWITHPSSVYITILILYVTKLMQYERIWLLCRIDPVWQSMWECVPRASPSTCVLTHPLKCGYVFHLYLRLMSSVLSKGSSFRVNAAYVNL